MFVLSFLKEAYIHILQMKDMRILEMYIASERSYQYIAGRSRTIGSDDRYVIRDR